jgi:hypothetical protein
MKSTDDQLAAGDVERGHKPALLRRLDGGDDAQAETLAPVLAAGGAAPPGLRSVTS